MADPENTTETSGQLGDRIELTVMFADLADSTRIKEQNERAASDEISLHNRTVAEIVMALDGEEGDGSGSVAYVAKFIGDEVMAVFHKGYEALALTAAVRARETLEIREAILGSALRSKIGIATGHAFPYNFEWFKGAPMDVLGLTVDRAACLARIAQPGQILVDGQLRESAELNGTQAASYSEPEWTVLGTGVQMTQVFEVLPVDGKPLGVQNYPRLRPELKLLEESLTNFLSGADGLRVKLVEVLEKPDIGNRDIEAVKRRYEGLARNNGHLAIIKEFFHDESELQRCDGVMESYDSLWEHYRNACDRLAARTADQFNDPRSTARTDHASDFSALRNAAEDLQFIADQFIKQIDGTDGARPIVRIGP